MVLGYVVRGPLGGHAWHHLHYVAGLAAMGHDVWFIEDSDDYATCYDPVLDVVSTNCDYGLRFAANAFESIGLGERWAFRDSHLGEWKGGAARVAESVCRSADIILNVSAANPLREWLAGVPVRVFIDTDPAFTQATHLTDPSARSFAASHTHFFTFAENVGAGAALPVDGLPWIPTRQPIALALWPKAQPPAAGSFTTVMLWDSYRTVEACGIKLGMKSQSFEPYLDLPAHVSQPMELAVGGPTAPRAQLSERGWRVLDSRVPTRSLESYRQYIENSRAEFSVAKHGYVATRAGWFSERSANYLATGRPVVTQDSGFSAVLPVGKGLMSFTTPDEAVAAIEEVAGNYEHHCLAAREIAEEYFDCKSVLGRLLDESFKSPQPSVSGP